MGVLKQTGNWAIDVSTQATYKVTDYTVSELMRCKKALDNVLDMFPKVQFGFLHSFAAYVSSLLDQVLAISFISWGKEKTFFIWIKFYDSVEQLIRFIAPLYIAPRDFVIEKLTMVKSFVFNFICDSFGKFDDKLVTPVYQTSIDFTVATYDCVKTTAVLPVTNCVSGYVINPTVGAITGTAKAAKNKSISWGAWIDSKTSVVDLMLKVVEKSRAVDSCISGGRIESKLYKPVLNTAISLDNKILKGSAQELVEQCKSEWEAEKNGSKKASVAAKTSVPGRNLTAAGAPHYVPKVSAMVR